MRVPEWPHFNAVTDYDPAFAADVLIVTTLSDRGVKYEGRIAIPRVEDTLSASEALEEILDELRGALDRPQV